MARRVKRNVQRGPGRQGIVRSYNSRAWYQLPDWAVAWVSDSAWFAALVFAAFLAPATLLGIVLGAHALPLEFLGVPGTTKVLTPTDNGVGLATLVLIINFFLMAAAIRPLRRLERKGWYLMIAASAVHFVHSLILQHAITAGVLLVFVAYCYTQVRHRLS